MKPLGRKKVKFPSKTKAWLGKGARMWWETIAAPDKQAARQKAKRDIAADIELEQGDE